MEKIFYNIQWHSAHRYFTTRRPSATTDGILEKSNLKVPAVPIRSGFAARRPSPRCSLYLQVPAHHLHHLRSWQPRFYVLFSACTSTFASGRGHTAEYRIFFPPRDNNLLFLFRVDASTNAPHPQSLRLCRNDGNRQRIVTEITLISTSFSAK